MPTKSSRLNCRLFYRACLNKKIDMIKKSAVTVPLLICSMLFSSASLKGQTETPSDLNPVGPEAFEVMRQFFDYDEAVPLEAHIVERLDTSGFVREKILFRGSGGNEVPGYLAIPKNESTPFPLVLLLHGVNSSKESWWEENSTMRQLTDELLESGFSILSLDAQYHGERAGNNTLQSPTDLLKNEWFVHFRDMIIESAIDYRRGIDYLAARPEIDTSQIGVVGYSMGGIMSFILSAVDSRIDVSVSCVSPIVTVPYLPTAVHNFAPFTKDTPFLMMMGKEDQRNYSVETASQLHDLIDSNDKDLVFFDSGHMLPAEWTSHAKEWLLEYLQ